MKKIIDTFKNIFKIEELKKRIIYTVLLLMAFRFGSYVILPGIDSQILSNMFQQGQGSGILGMINTFVGGAFSRGSIFALGIMPYISASIIIQLMTVVLPSLRKLQKEGESGTRKINQLTRYLAIGVTAVQGIAYISNLFAQYSPAIKGSHTLFWVSSIFILTAGTIFLLWLGERITENGIGQGVSLIIAVGIIADLPSAVLSEAQLRAPMLFYFEVIILAVVTMSVILYTKAVRKIPVNYAKRMVGNKMMGGLTSTQKSYIPLKLYAANVMPIIFAQAIMFIPPMIASAFPDSDLGMGTQNALYDFKGFWYNLIFVVLIIVFTYFYTAIAVNPDDIAEQLKRSGGYISGVKPGKKTAEYIDTIMTRITLPGAIFLAGVAILPAIVARFGVSTQFAYFFGGTSLLIMISTVLETLQQIESYLLMRHYDGLTGSGKIRGRTPNRAGAAI